MGRKPSWLVVNAAGVPLHSAGGRKQGEVKLITGANNFIVLETGLDT